MKFILSRLLKNQSTIALQDLKVLSKMILDRYLPKSVNNNEKNSNTMRKLSKPFNLKTTLTSFMKN